jgi:hypothetical protein
MGIDKNPLWRATALWALVWLGAGCLNAQSASAAKTNSPVKLSAVRFWSLSDATRVAIELSGDFEYEADRLQNPDRVFFDIHGAVPVLEGKAVRKLFTLDVDDGLVKKIRIAQTRKNVTRVVFDLHKAADYSASLLRNPNRLMVELRQKGSGAPEEGSVPTPALAMAGEEQHTAAGSGSGAGAGKNAGAGGSCDNDVHSGAGHPRAECGRDPGTSEGGSDEAIYRTPGCERRSGSESKEYPSAGSRGSGDSSSQDRGAHA